MQSLVALSFFNAVATRRASFAGGSFTFQGSSLDATAPFFPPHPAPSQALSIALIDATAVDFPRRHCHLPIGSI
jgi:hypothetical protein